MIRSTTILCVRKDGHVAMAGDGQVSMNNTVVKHHARQRPKRHAGSRTAGGDKHGFASLADIGQPIHGLDDLSGPTAIGLSLRQKAAKLYQRFEHWGFWTVTVPALLPPPFPMVPFLIAAGALQYSRKKFLGALALGRGIRFFVIAFLGQVYGKAIASFFSKYYKPALFTLIGLAVLGGVLALVEYLRMRRKPHQAPATSRPKAA